LPCLSGLPVQSPLAEAGVKVALVGGNLCIKSVCSPRQICAISCKINSIHPALQRIKAAHQRGLGNDRGEGDLGIIRAPLLQQQFDVVEARLVVVRVLEQRFGVVVSGRVR